MPAWNFLPSTISLKRKRADSPDVEEPPAKRHTASKLVFPQPITQREIRKTIPVSPGRHRLEKVRDKNDVERRRQWINESMPPFLGCVCKAHILAFCICPDMAQGPRVFSTLPPEIVQQIFDMFIPPETLLDPSLHCGPNSAWCNAMVAKRALVLVSKDWYDNAIGYLYRDIVIRRLFGLEAMYATLNAAPRLGKLVRSITFASYVPPQWYDRIYYSMQRVLELCPNVKSVNDLPPFMLPVRYSFPDLPPTVTSIKISPHDNTADILEILQLTCGQLEELSLPAVDDERFDAETLVFPHLRSLCLTISSSTENPNPPLQTFATKWRIPQLQRLTFRDIPHLDDTVIPADYHHILVRHGRRLEYLAFPNVYPEMLEPEDMEDFGPLLQLCPSLTHVVLPAYAVVSGTYTFPTVKWLDHWCLQIHTTPHTGEDVLLAFPALLGYRLLDVALSVHIADVPGTFDPCARGAWTITFPGMAIEQAQDGPDGVPRLMLGDLSAVADWDISYFGAMETNTVQREQEYFDLGWGKLQRFPFPPPMPLVFDDPIGHEIDPDEPRLDRDACRNIPAPYHLQWLQDETDDEESDLESEDVGDLDDEFYQETEPIPDPVMPQWAHPPASISTRGSFPWLSNALQSTLFGPFIS